MWDELVYGNRERKKKWSDEADESYDLIFRAAGGGLLDMEWWVVKQRRVVVVVSSGSSSSSSSSRVVVVEEGGSKCLCWVGHLFCFGGPAALGLYRWQP